MNTIQFPVAKILPRESTTDRALYALTASCLEMTTAIAEAQTVAEAYQLFRYLSEIERAVMQLTTAAMQRCEQLELEAEVGL